jgi:hypothetical protein
MEKFPEYANLEGLKACNLTKRTEKGNIKISNSEEIKDEINHDDTLYFDLMTEEYWINTTIKMHSSNCMLTIALDIKFRTETFFTNLKFLLIKFGIMFWMEHSKGRDDFYHYIFTNAKFKTLKSKNNMEFNVMDINKSLHIGKSIYA